MNSVLDWVQDILDRLRRFPVLDLEDGLEPSHGTNHTSGTEQTQGTDPGSHNAEANRLRVELINQSIKSIVQFCENECSLMIDIISKFRREHEKPETHQCNVCSEEFSSGRNLTKHKKTHKKERGAGFVCGECGRDCYSTARLERHKRTHSGAKPFVCDQCGARYQQLNDLSRHLRKHELKGGVSGVVCPVRGCGRRLATNHTLNVHLRIHSGEKPHACSLCGKSFRTSSAARRHNLVHSGVRNHFCKICFKPFQTSGHLKQHERTHQDGLEQDRRHQEGLERDGSHPFLQVSGSTAVGRRNVGGLVAHDLILPNPSNKIPEEFDMNTDFGSLSRSEPHLSKTIVRPELDPTDLDPDMLSDTAVLDSLRLFHSSDS